MREAKKRKVYSPEFKAKVGLEALRGMKTINETEKQLAALQKSPHLVRSFFNAPSVAYIGDC